MSPTSEIVRLEDVFDDPDVLRAFAVAQAPFAAPVSGYNDPPNASRLPWFKALWSPGSPVDGRAIFENARLIEGAAKVFGAEVVRPEKILVNAVGPMPALPPHLDPPNFRGVDRWLAAPDARRLSRFTGPRALVGLMGASGLFERWRVHSATAVTWHYSGPNGEYVYWPDGSDAPPRTEAPTPNVALVGDNDRMFHSIGNVGRPEQYLATGTITATSELRKTDSGWALVDGSEVRATWSDDDVRISVVWKALCFRDEAEAEVFDSRSDDVTVQQVVDTFDADLRSRGIAVARPGDPFTDSRWYRNLLRVYGFAKPPEQGAA